MGILAGCDQPSATGTSSVTGNSVSGNSRAPTGEPEPVAQVETGPELTRKVAGVGDGKKGHTYGKLPMTYAASQSWRIKEKLVFEIEIPRSLQIYKNINPRFEGPQSHEEFMEKIIKEYHIVLPELPDGHRYVYDPDKEQLLVEQPVAKSSK